METTGSPGKKKSLKKAICSRPKKCLIQIVGSAEDNTSSTFAEHSKKVII